MNCYFLNNDYVEINASHNIIFYSTWKMLLAISDFN